MSVVGDKILGLFIGLSTLDFIYLAEGPPQANQKVVARESAISSGGPATNAAVTFAHLGNQAQLLTAMGTHPMTQLMRSDLEEVGVAMAEGRSLTIANLTPSQVQSPAISSIIVTESTGERAIISLNAQRQQAQPEQIPPEVWERLDATKIILIDGHQIDISVAISAQATNIPIVLDGGSWKPGLENVLPYVHYAICSANFYPPGCSKTEATIKYLQDRLPQPTRIAITQGDQPILYRDGKIEGTIPVPDITPVDTLGAGDVFHGAFCHFILSHAFPEALAQAAQVAATACQSFGTRAWLQEH
ncbi:Sulfofructose kinase [Acaryochloris thomasi RCC1774]|uniref:Sulfofructose kinase n=1 Tax=Acaryochloris thomasi RCC1774 TaxID=1764569 RepID=A0A2W1JLQ5_9CYAN|nr:PfkB family carbohydrate kinase [Acaryochloris thomasi]PZD71104.1 Sulfofructose kinase [Acaryochloris thomasi RCC1774]